MRIKLNWYTIRTFFMMRIKLNWYTIRTFFYAIINFLIILNIVVFYGYKGYFESKHFLYRCQSLSKAFYSSRLTNRTSKTQDCRPGQFKLAPPETRFSKKSLDELLDPTECRSGLKVIKSFGGKYKTYLTGILFLILYHLTNNH